MLRVCRACDPPQYTLKPRCPKCGTATVQPYGTASKPTGGGLGPIHSLGRPTLGPAIVDIAPARTSYALVHTLGGNTPDDMGGDGAYANWLHDHFSRNKNALGCVDVQRLIFTGRKTGSTGEFISRMIPQFTDDLRRYLAVPAVRTTRTIVLNWHIRYTGRPNAWTGRGSSQEMVAALQRMVAEAGYRLIVLYTVHESEGLGGDPWRYQPSSLMALNPDVRGQIAHQFGERVALSRVPGLMTCVHTSSVDLILRYLEGESSAVVHTAAAMLLQQFRLRTVPSRLTNHARRQTQGIVVFGMITARHGLSADIIRHLCRRLAMYGFGRDFKVVIAGKTQTAALESDLRAIDSARLVFHGTLDLRDGFTTLAGCRYAMSFDPLGFRDNASAQVNVTRAGHLLFSRNSGEACEAMIERALVEIVRCERDPERFTDTLIAQSSRFINTSPSAVGNELDQFLRRLASGEHQ